jgi:hypothetical protein
MHTHSLGIRESAEFPTGVKEALTLLVNSKTHGKARVHTMFESQSDRAYASAEAYSDGVGD